MRGREGFRGAGVLIRGVDILLKNTREGPVSLSATVHFCCSHFNTTVTGVSPGFIRGEGVSERTGKSSL